MAAVSLLELANSVYLGMVKRCIHSVYIGLCKDVDGDDFVCRHFKVAFQGFQSIKQSKNFRFMPIRLRINPVSAMAVMLCNIREHGHTVNSCRVHGVPITHSE